jgi:uncharacterized protein
MHGPGGELESLLPCRRGPRQMGTDLARWRHPLNFEAEPANPEIQSSEPSAPPPPAPRTASALERIFTGSDGIRAGWRVAIYIFLLFIFGAMALGAVLHLHVMRRVNTPAIGIIVQEVPVIVVLLLASWVMTFIEKRPLGRYGLPLRGAFGSRFWQGACWGFLQLTLLLRVIHVLGGFSFGTLALHGSAIAEYALLYALGFLLVGLAEEYMFRGYLQFTLSRGMGFWPAAIFTSSLFACAHLANPGEKPLGIAMVVTDGLFCCLTLWRTGNLWWAVGNHASWDFAQSFVYGVPDSGLIMNNHLMNSSFHGPVWLTGGSVGPEGSVLIPVLFAVTIVAFHFCYPKREYSDVS